MVGLKTKRMVAVWMTIVCVLAGIAFSEEPVGQKKSRSLSCYFPAMLQSNDEGAKIRLTFTDAQNTNDRLSIPVFSGDIDGDGKQDCYDFNGTSGASFTPLVFSVTGAKFKSSPGPIYLKFSFNNAGTSKAKDNGYFRLWTKDASEARITEQDLITNGKVMSANDLGWKAGQPLTLYLEGVNPTPTPEGAGKISVDVSVGDKEFASDMSASVTARAVEAWVDVDIDSDNNGRIDHSQWEEELEANSYALGKLLNPLGRMQDTSDVPDAYSTDPIQIALPKGLDLDDPDISVQLDYKIVAKAGTVRVSRVLAGRAKFRDVDIREGGDLCKPRVDYTLKELGYVPATGLIDLSILGYGEATDRPTKTPIDTLVALREFGKPQDKIKVTLSVGSVKAVDEVKYLVAHKPSIFWEIQNRPEVRSAFAANAVYHQGEAAALEQERKFGLKCWTQKELEAAGVSVSSLRMLNQAAESETIVLGDFTASLYQDYTAAKRNTFILAFADGDFPKRGDWPARIAQEAKSESILYLYAAALGYRLPNSMKAALGDLTVTVAGHSLGGGYASAAALFGDLEGDIFNAAGLRQGTLLFAAIANLSGSDDLTFNQLKTKYALAATAKDSNDSGLTHYYNTADILTAIQTSSPDLLNAMGVQKPLTTGPHDKDYPVSEQGTVEIKNVKIMRESHQHYIKALLGEKIYGGFEN